MAFIVADRVREVSASIGTGVFNLSGSPIGYQTFSASVGNGNTTYYVISNPGVNEWEVGIGTVGAGTLTRTTVLASSNGGTAVNFTAGSKDVFVTYPAEAAVFADNTVTLTNKTISVDTNTVAGVAASSFVLSNASGNIDGAAAQKAIPSGVVVGTSDTQTLTNKTFGDNPVFSAGTAKSIPYLNGSKVLTTGSALTFDGTNLATTGALTLGANNNLTWGGVYGANIPTIAGASNTLQFYPAGSTSGEQMRLTSTGLGIGTSVPGYKLDVGIGAGPNGISISNAGSGSDYARWTVNTSTGEIAFGAARSGVGNYFQTFYTAGTEKMRLDVSGNLGLGVTPSAWDAGFTVLENTGGSVFSGSVSRIRIGQNLFYNSGFKYKNTAQASYYEQVLGAHQWYTAPSGTAGNAISFTQAMTLDTSGQLGVGTTSPTAQMQVYAQDSVSGKALRVAYNGTYYTDITEQAIHTYANPLLLETKSNYPITFNTNATERMRIDSSGNLLVGMTSAVDGGKLSILSNGSNAVVSKQNSAGGWCYTAYASNNGGTYYLMSFMAGVTQVGSITSNGTTTTYGTLSDYRLKENIQPMQNALGVVAQLNPVRYTWKADGSDGQGFIAHELQAVVPDCVTGEKDAVDKDGKPVYQGIDTSFLVATLTAAIKELKAELDATKAEVAALKAIN